MIYIENNNKATFSKTSKTLDIDRVVLTNQVTKQEYTIHATPVEGGNGKYFQVISLTLPRGSYDYIAYNDKEVIGCGILSNLDETTNGNTDYVAYKYREDIITYNPEEEIVTPNDYTINIYRNGEYNVENYDLAIVNVFGGEGGEDCAEIVEGLQQEIDALEDKNAALTQTNSNLNVTNKQLQKEVEVLEGENEILTQTNTTLTQEKNTLSNEVKQLNNSVSNLQSQVSKLNDDINVLQGEKEALEATKNALEEDLETSNNNVEYLSGRITDLNAEISRLNDRINNLTTEKNNLQRELNNLQYKYNQIANSAYYFEYPDEWTRLNKSLIDENYKNLFYSENNVTEKVIRINVSGLDYEYTPYLYFKDCTVTDEEGRNYTSGQQFGTIEELTFTFTGNTFSFEVDNESVTGFGSEMYITQLDKNITKIYTKQLDFRVSPKIELLNCPTEELVIYATPHYGYYTDGDYNTDFETPYWGEQNQISKNGNVATIYPIFDVANMPEDEKDKMIESLNEEIATLQSQKEALEEAIVNKDREIQDLEKEVVQLENRVNKLIEEKTTLQSQVEGLESVINTLNGEITNLQAEVNSLTTEVNNLRSDYVNLQAEYSQLNEEKNTLQTTLQTEINRLQTEVFTLEDRVENLQGEVVELNETIEGLNGQISNLQTEITNKNQQIQTLQNDLYIANDTIANLQDKVNSVTSITITENGTCTTNEGTLGYNRITVNVKRYETVYITQAEYDALAMKENNVFYLING